LSQELTAMKLRNKRSLQLPCSKNARTVEAGSDTYPALFEPARSVALSRHGLPVAVSVLRRSSLPVRN
jgi:hypothetical protein